jgi:UDP-N-acetylmuramate dehydrogenase
LPGTVILNQTGTLEQVGSNRFRAESGLNWDDLVHAAIANNLWGLEFASGIPGGVGAAISGNIAAYGHKVADVLVEATVLDPQDSSIAVWPNDAFGFDYRSSNLQLPRNQHLVVLDATFELATEPTGELEYHSALKTAKELGLKPDSLEHRRKIIIETRRHAGSLLRDAETGPWTAGSFFKNPLVGEDQIHAILSHEESSITEEQLLRQNQLHSGNKARVSAAHVLLAAGFHRGQTWGNVRLHPDHILKLENLGQASAREMYDVVQTILGTVKEKLGIELEPEVRFLGDFS